MERGDQEIRFGCGRPVDGSRHERRRSVVIHVGLHPCDAGRVRLGGVFRGVVGEGEYCRRGFADREHRGVEGPIEVPTGSGVRDPTLVQRIDRVLECGFGEVQQVVIGEGAGIDVRGPERGQGPPGVRPKVERTIGLRPTGTPRRETALQVDQEPVEPIEAIEHAVGPDSVGRSLPLALVDLPPEHHVTDQPQVRHYTLL